MATLTNDSVVKPRRTKAAKTAKPADSPAVTAAGSTPDDGAKPEFIQFEGQATPAGYTLCSVSGAYCITPPGMAAVPRGRRIFILNESAKRYIASGQCIPAVAEAGESFTFLAANEIPIVLRAGSPWREPALAAGVVVLDQGSAKAPKK